MSLIYKSKLLKYHKTLTSWRYPYRTTLRIGNISAQYWVHSPVERYRVQKWGGEKDFVKFLVSNLAKDEIFYDIGSSIGLISILAAKKLVQGKVIAFEPDSDIMSRFRKNVKLNKLKNTKAIMRAVGSSNTTTELYSDGADSSSPGFKNTQGMSSSKTVKVITLDSFIKNKNIPTPTTIKIDIEGAEHSALLGMDKLLRSSFKPHTIYIEEHAGFIKLYGSSIYKLRNYINNRGYKTISRNIIHDQTMSHYRLY